MPYKDKEKQRKSDREYRARRRLRSVELGLCTNCGNVPPRDGFKECVKCSEIKRKYSNRMSKTHKERRVLNGRCYSCNRPMFGDTHKNCMICRQSKSERGDDNQWSL
jgi:hypothetical protein